MDDLATLQIRVKSLEAVTAEKRLKGVATSGAKAEKATDGLTSAFARFAGPAALIAGTLAGMTKLVSVTRQFEVLNAQLVTATGSSENAAQAFGAIQDFASNTPYDLQQVTESFTKLVNLGLTPSEKALTSYGNTASAMGKDLNQLIEAVADAATGEFERLKEFGIKSKSEGDNVSFTFRGITTTVGKNAAEIEGYLMALGENEFAGAMAARMDTLDGALSNLGDEWDKLFLNISNQGVGDVIEDSVRLALDVISELNAMLESGEMEAHLDAIGGKFDGFGKDIAFTVDYLTTLWDDFFGDTLQDGSTDAISFMKDAFSDMPENIRAFIQIMTVELAAFIDKTVAYGSEIAENLQFWKDETFDLEGRLAVIDSARQQSIGIILDERGAALDSYAKQAEAAENLRWLYDQANKARKADTSDRLAEFSKGADPAKAANEESEADKKKREKLEKAAAKAAQKLKDDRAQSLADLVDDLRTEEEVISESYTKRLAIILDNTEKGSEKQLELKKRLDAEFATQAIGELSAPDTYDEQLAQLEDYFQRRRELILSNTAITEEERTVLEEELTRNRNERIDLLEKERLAVILSGATAVFDGLAGLAKTFAGEQSDTYKVLFAASKAFAIADAAIQIQAGIGRAIAIGFPANIPVIAETAALGANVISTISGTNFAGAYDEGGQIPQGKIGLVGEFGPELIQGPANITSRKDTADAFREGKEGGGATPVTQNNIRIVNTIDPSVMNDYLGSSPGEEVILNIIRNNPETIRAVTG